MNRYQVIRSENNTLILDAYNANPDGMKAALQNFANFPAEKKMLLLGDMFELGEYAGAEHAAILEMARTLRFQTVIFVGTEFSKLDTEPYPHFNSTAEAMTYLQSLSIKGATVLIKGSRSMKMETLQQAL